MCVFYMMMKNISISGIFVFLVIGCIRNAFLQNMFFLSEDGSCSLRIMSKSPLSKSMSLAQNCAREQEPFHHPSAPSENPLSFGHVGWISQSVCLFVMAVHLNTKVPPDGAINE